MEKGSSQEEPLKNRSRKKMRNKSNKQATVLKQLNNQNLYPIQERIGIYVVAILSALGLILITYTGVMALVSTAENETYTPVDIDVDVDEVSDMLGDLEDLLDDDDEPEELDHYDANEDLYVDADDADDANDVADEDEEINEDEEIDEDEDPEDSENGGTIGIINDNVVNLWREPGSPDAMLSLQEGYEVIIIDYDYNAYWAHVEVETDAWDGVATIQGFILREFIDVVE